MISSNISQKITKLMRTKISKNLFIKTTLAILLIVMVVFLLKIQDISSTEDPTGAAAAASGQVSITISGAAPECSIDVPLFYGWNLISIECEQDDDAIETVLSSISGNYTSVESYVKNDTSDPWKAYNPSLPQFSDLDYLFPGYGLWLNTSVNETWEVS